MFNNMSNSLWKHIIALIGKDANASRSDTKSTIVTLIMMLIYLFDIVAT